MFRETVQFSDTQQNELRSLDLLIHKNFSFLIINILKIEHSQITRLNDSVLFIQV
jgi:hypothetical protein